MKDIKDIEDLKESMASVREHIDSDCVSDDEYGYISKGYIFHDTKSFCLAKEYIGYSDLKEKKKVIEIFIDDSWTSLMKESPDNPDARKFWNQLVSAAYSAYAGVLVINISNPMALAHCWKLKQLIKQEHPLQLWPEPNDDFRSDETKFRYNGFVFIVLQGFTIQEAREFAEKENNVSEFDALKHYSTICNIE